MKKITLVLAALAVVALLVVAPASASPLKCPKGSHRNHNVCVVVKVKRIYVPVAIPGPQGEPGPAGPAGATGPAGPTTPGGITRHELEEEVIKGIEFCIAHPGFGNICNEEAPIP